MITATSATTRYGVAQLSTSTSSPLEQWFAAQVDVTTVLVWSPADAPQQGLSLWLPSEMEPNGIKSNGSDVHDGFRIGTATDLAANIRAAFWALTRFSAPV